MTGRNGELDGEESRARQGENTLQTIGKLEESEMVSKNGHFRESHILSCAVIIRTRPTINTFPWASRLESDQTRWPALTSEQSVGIIVGGGVSSAVQRLLYLASTVACQAMKKTSVTRRAMIEGFMDAYPRYLPKCYHNSSCQEYSSWPEQLLQEREE